MPTLRRLITATALAGLTCLVLAGCGTLSGLDWLGGGKQRHLMIQFYRLAPTSDAQRRDVQEISTSTGRPILIYTRVLLSSINIKDARAVTFKGRAEAELLLDLSGSRLWMELRRDLAGEELAVVVDGWCRGIVQVAPPVPGENPDLIYLPGPWNAKDLREIVRQAPINYELLHKF